MRSGIHQMSGPVIAAVTAGKGRERTVKSIICDLVEQLRGVRPHVRTTLASLGIDSLSTVIFVRRISDSLGGIIRVEPSLIFATGMTIEQLSFVLEERMRQIKPELFTTLNITPLGESDIEAVGCEDADDVDDQSQLLGSAPSEVDSVFESVISANRRLIQGVRGILTFLVLWDHFHVSTC